MSMGEIGALWRNGSGYPFCLRGMVLEIENVDLIAKYWTQ